MRIDLTIVQLNAIRTHLADQFEDDERGWMDLIEGETDAFEIVRRLLDGIEADEGDKAALKSQIDDRKIRSQRCDARIDARREAIMAIMEAAKLDKLTLAEATLSLRTLAASLKVNDPNAVPEGFCTMKPVPNMDIIKSAFSPGGELPNWLRAEPERPSLTIRRK